MKRFTVTAEPGWLRQRALALASRALSRALTREEVLELSVSHTAQLLGATKVALVLKDAEQSCSVKASHGLDLDRCERFRETWGEAVGEALQSLLVDVQEQDEPCLLSQLVVGGEVVGFLGVVPEPAGAAREEQQWLLSALCAQVAAALELNPLDETASFRDRMFALSHELRNPVAAIVMTTDLLLRRQMDERTTRVVMRIQSSAKRAINRVQDIVDYTQARLNGSLPVHTQQVDLHAVMRAAVKEAAVAHPERRVEVRHSGDGWGEWDADRLPRVVSKLLGSASGHSHADAPLLLEAFEQDDGVVLKVHAQGNPIPAEGLPRVFDAAPASARGSKGPGVDLYLVRHIVEAHGGKAFVESTATSGTSLWVWLPRRQSQAVSGDGSRAVSHAGSRAVSRTDGNS